MKKARILSNILILLFTFLFIGCKHQPSETLPALRTAERLINTDPDSASSVLKHLPSPEKLDDETFAHWCMLSGKVTDKINTPILPTFHLDRALKWYENNGTQEEQAQMKLYLGRSYVADGNYDKAMAIYIDALEIAEKNKLHNLCGYINCYMGDLYEQEDMQKQAIDKYKTGANKFKTANNVRSYACALRDVGREYALMDSLSRALKVMQKADSIAIRLNDDNVKASISNSLGNIYQMQHKYGKAKTCFIKALRQGNNKMPSYIALVKLYIEADSIPKAYELLQKVPQNNPEYTYSIKGLYHLIYKAKGDYKKALENLEEYTELIDSIVYADNQSKVLEIETKYNVLKAQSEIDDLKIAKQKYIIILTVSIAFTLLILLSYHIYRKQTISKIQKQQEELNQTKIKLLDLSLELEKKRNQLETAKAKNENVDKLQEEIADLSLKYKKLQNNILTNSAIYKKLSQLAKQNMPGNDKPLITDNLWQLITDAITVAYPNLEKLVYDLCPDLTSQEWQYCCFYMFNYDSSDEAKLLNISPSSARTKHLRLRQRLNITLESKTTLYEYLINSID
ncbi:tetratricopeptide repeat protein [Bacteroides ihuae]|uniref:tetratricopeptide repeat protein n=1 Tax=Bacteroides ihuae TaxID=1852362 RepID=UPI0008D9D72A|nr:tetratricopeptide repeat protein [Bacteroides ihuae]